MRNLGTGSRENDRDDVKANGLLPIGFKNVGFGSGHHPRSFFCGDGGFGKSEIEIRPGFHFDEHQPVATPDDEVDFRPARPVVADHDFVALRGEVLSGQGFAALSGFEVTGHLRKFGEPFRGKRYWFTRTTPSVMPPNTPKLVQLRNLGLIDYQSAWDLQERLFAETITQKVRNRDLPETEQSATTNHLLVCEHPHVYTLGKSGKPEHLLLDEAQLEAVGARYYKINRGGDITYHGPGQLVVYPIFDLDHFFTDIHRYMRTLEEAVIQTCADFGLETGRIAGLTGVWVDFIEQKNPRKICAMGVKSSRWVTMHGLALNVSPDLGYFQHIVPCGIVDKAVTSLAQELETAPTVPDVAQRLTGHLRDLFECDWETESVPEAEADRRVPAF